MTLRQTGHGDAEASNTNISKAEGAETQEASPARAGPRKSEVMADPLDAALQRSLLLGLQVLERASRRRVDWAQTGAADRRLRPALRESRETPPPTPQSSAEELRAAFSSICGSMRQTCTHCQRFHDSLSARSDSEQRHVWRFHRQSPAPEQQPRDVSSRSPRRQTRPVSLADGESAEPTSDL